MRPKMTPARQIAMNVVARLEAKGVPLTVTSFGQEMTDDERAETMKHFIGELAKAVSDDHAD